MTYPEAVKKAESPFVDSMQIAELRKLVATGEGWNLEFKRKAAVPEKIVREMIALANTRGGVLLIGVDDNGGLAGLKHPEDDVHVVSEMLKHCKPELTFTISLIPLSNTRIIVRYDIPESLQKPHRLAFENGRTETYVRVEDRSIRASRELREIMRRGRKLTGIAFHYGPSEEKIIKYLDQHKTITLNEFRELSGLNKHRASGTLIRLVLADVLRIIPNEHGDRFTLTQVHP